MMYVMTRLLSPTYVGIIGLYSHIKYTVFLLTCQGICSHIIIMLYCREDDRLLLIREDWMEGRSPRDFKDEVLFLMEGAPMDTRQDARGWRSPLWEAEPSG